MGLRNRRTSDLRQDTEIARLTRERDEALEREAATSEVLQVISSSPADLEPVFASMLEKAVRICDAKFGNIYRWNGEAFQVVAMHNTPPAFAELRRSTPYRPDSGHIGRMVTTKSVVHIVDAAESCRTCRMSARILVVDDEPDVETLILQRFRQKIKDEAISFLFARDGLEALATLKTNSGIDLVSHPCAHRARTPTHCLALTQRQAPRLQRPRLQISTALQEISPLERHRPPKPLSISHLKSFGDVKLCRIA